MTAGRWIAALALAATGCSTITELWTGGPRELPRTRDDVVELGCSAGKRLTLRMEPGGKAAWIVLPEREFRLDPVAGGPGSRFTNGRTTLVVTGEEFVLEEGGAVSLANCRKP